MKNIYLYFMLLFTFASCEKKDNQGALDFADEQVIISKDLNHFFNAFDSVMQSSDSLEKTQFIQELFVDKASDGQKRMFRARNYRLSDYYSTMSKHPQFWNSLKERAKGISQYENILRRNIVKLKEVYPDLSPSTIYYTIGAHRSPGTGVDSMVLIGSEFAIGDSMLAVSELRASRQEYYKNNPIDYLDFLVVHEYIHTQQEDMVHNLLCLSLYEGIAEFVAIKATGKPSPFKAFTYGPKHEKKVIEQFEFDMFNPTKVYSWLWNSPNNQFGTQDLGYYVGFRIASIFYEKAKNKQAAIKSLIELDYSNDKAISKLVDDSKIFSAPLNQLQEEFESQRPELVEIPELDAADSLVSPELKIITLKFSKPMNPKVRGFDYGPLGENHVLRVQRIIGFTEDRKAFQFEVRLKPGQRYQSLVTNRFVSEDGRPLLPYLIDFTCKN